MPETHAAMVKAKVDKFTYMTTEKVPKLIMELSVPTIISMLVTSFYNMADTYFVGKLDTQSTAAVGITFSVMAMIQAMGFFFGHGSGNYISRHLGAKDYKAAEKMAATGFFSALIAGVLFATIGLIFLRPLCIMLGSTPTILPYTEQYMGIILLGAPFMTASLVLNNQMRFQGNAVYAMVGITTGAILNIILAPILIFIFHMGVKGAAIATVISQICSFLLLLYMDSRGSNIKIRARNFTPRLSYLKEITGGGAPSLFRQGLGCTATALMNVAAGAYGDAAIAGMSIVGRVCFFISAVVIGFGQGFQPVCGFNYGAGLNSRVRKGFWFCVKGSFLFMLAVSIVGFICSEPIIKAFREGDPAVTSVGVSALRWQLVTFPLGAFIIMSNMMLQTIRKSVRATILASARQGLFFIPLIIILPQYLGLTGVEMCQAGADLLSFLLALPLTIPILKRLKSDRPQFSEKQPV